MVLNQDGETRAERASGSSPELLTGRASHDDPEEISLLELADLLLKRWKLLVALPTVGAVIGLVVGTLNTVELYEATATFIPEGGSREPTGLRAIASQFGFGSPSSSTPQLYQTILRSRTFLEDVLETRITDPDAPEASKTIRLYDYIGPSGATDIERNLKATGWLLQGLVVSVGAANVVSITYQSESPTLSADLANAFVDFLNRFNTESRQSSVRERRRFIEERLADAATELLAAEEELKQYLDQNRDLNAPELQFPYQRLQRQLNITTEVYMTLRRQYEDARIQEVNDTPVITVIDRAIPPLRAVPFSLRRNAAIGFVFGGMLALLVAVVQGFTERARERDDPDFRRLTWRLKSIKDEVLSVIPGVGPRPEA